jgi:hypothetical protein
MDGLFATLILSFHLALAQEGAQKKFTINEDLKNRIENLFNYQLDKNDPWTVHRLFDRQFKQAQSQDEKSLMFMVMDYITDCEMSSGSKSGKCLYQLKRYGRFHRVINLVNELHKENAPRKRIIDGFTCTAAFISTNQEVDLLSCVSAVSKNEQIEFVAKP